MEQSLPAGVPKPDHLPKPLSAAPANTSTKGIVPLAVSASTQESSTVALGKEVVPTGTLPTPPEKGKRPEKKRDYTIDDHKLTVPQVGARFGTQLDVSAPSKSAGLTAAEAARRLAVYGSNTLTPPAEIPEILKYLYHFTDRAEGAGGGGCAGARAPHPAPRAQCSW